MSKSNQTGSTEILRQGDIIGRYYEVLDILGKGGFGIVYLVFSHETKEIYALKTFIQEHLLDVTVRQWFRKEAEVWVKLGRHPNIVTAYFVDEIDGRLYIAMEYIPPTRDGLNTLEGYLYQEKLEIPMQLSLAVQACRGLKHAFASGLICHRDVKPANILVANGRIAKVSDFGLAKMRSTSGPIMQERLNNNLQRSMGKTETGALCGTPQYMAPEQFENPANADELSDIYSFGVVLHQVATGGRLPFPLPIFHSNAEEFPADLFVHLYYLHREVPIPDVDSPLAPIVRMCLAKKPEGRYQSFTQLLGDLEQLHFKMTRKAVSFKPSPEMRAGDWANKGNSLSRLGFYEQSLRCFEKAIEIDRSNAWIWSDYGVCYARIKKFRDAIKSFNEALTIDPNDAAAMANKALSLQELGFTVEAMTYAEAACKADPKNAELWLMKANFQIYSNNLEAAFESVEHSLGISSDNARALAKKAIILFGLSMPREAIQSCQEAVAIDPYNIEAWVCISECFLALGETEEALRCQTKLNSILRERK
ncbi:MAG TPA: serine/threonine-protein kinase [Nitrospirota bacterium]|nr:serine/threonine-protein kinase [Nitrospirota bacterium]